MSLYVKSPQTWDSELSWIWSLSIIKLSSYPLPNIRWLKPAWVTVHILKIWATFNSLVMLCVNVWMCWEDQFIYLVLWVWSETLSVCCKQWSLQIRHNFRLEVFLLGLKVRLVKLLIRKLIFCFHLYCKVISPGKKDIFYEINKGLLFKFV